MLATSRISSLAPPRGEVTTHNMQKLYSGCEVLTTVIMKNTVLCVVPLCGVETDRRFGVIYPVNLQFISGFCRFLDFLTLKPRRWGQFAPPNRLAVSELHGITTQMTIHFTDTPPGPQVHTVSQFIHRRPTE